MINWGFDEEKVTKLIDRKEIVDLLRTFFSSVETSELKIYI